MKHLLHQSGKTHGLIVLMSIAAFFTLALQYPASSQAAPPSAPPPAPKTAADQTQIFFPMVMGVAPAAHSSSKRGVGMPYPDCTDAMNAGVTWEYMWGDQPPDCPGLDNVPMIYADYNVNATLTSTSQWLMGFNEPDMAEQSNVSIPNAVAAWNKIEQKHPNRKLVAPAPSSVHPNWIVDFRNAYIAQYGKPPRLDALAMHCYLATAAACIQLGQSFENWAQAWGVKEIWLTEFAFLPCVLGGDDKAVSEGQKMINWVESEPMFTRMAWFASRIQGTESWAMSCNTPLLDWTTGARSTYGKMYAPNR